MRRVPAGSAAFFAASILRCLVRARGALGARGTWVLGPLWCGPVPLDGGPGLRGVMVSSRRDLSDEAFFSTLRRLLCALDLRALVRARGALGARGT